MASRFSSACFIGRWGHLARSSSIPCFRFLFSTLAIGALSACSIKQVILPSQLQVAVNQAPHASMDPASQRSSQAMYEFLVGQMALMDQDVAAAAKHLERASALSDAPSVVLNGSLADLYLREGKFDKALSELDKALLNAPTDYSLLLTRAGVLEALNRESEAQVAYELAAQSNILQVVPDPYVLWAKSLERGGNPSAALAVYEKLEKRAGKDPMAHYFISRAYEERGQFDKAERSMREAMRLDNSNSSFGLELVRILLKAARFKEAREVCRAILEKEPTNSLAQRLLQQLAKGEQALSDSVRQLSAENAHIENVPDSHLRVALLQLDRKDFGPALRELSLVLALSPDNTQARFYSANILAGSGRRKEAVQELLKIPQDDVLFLKSRTFAAFVLRQDGDLEGAEQAARQAHSEAPEDKNVLAYLVLILRDQRKFKDAAGLMRQAISQEPDNDKLLFSYAVLLRDMGEQQAADAEMEKLLQLNPNHPDALNYIAYGLAEKRLDLDRALSLIERALQSRPNDGYYLDTLGHIQFLRGEYSQAEASLSRAVSIVGDDVVILEHYADALVMLDRVERAIEVYRSAIEHGRDSSDAEQREAVARIEKKLAELIEREQTNTKKQ
ncbi:MAG: tetratricopeptide repeat protein [Oligoflexia bacterium]|nr:tetratricopeptide repeat protein [Oligoflexia bacterium]